MAGTKLTHENAFRAAEEALLIAKGVEIKEHIVDLERLGCRARILESGEGEPVLFVPGSQSPAGVFADLIRRLPDFRCLMIDRPGVGLSELVRDLPRTTEDHERLGDLFLADVQDGLDLKKSHVVSTSMGGFWTFRSLAAFPERFDRAVAIAYQIGASIEYLPRWLKLGMKAQPAPWMLPRRMRVNSWMVRKMLGPWGMKDVIESGKFSAELVDYFVATFRHTSTMRNDTLYGPRPTEHSRNLLASVSVPVHVVWGVGDVFGPEAAAQRFTEELANATVQMVNGNHAPWIDEPAVVADAVRRHLDG